MAGQIRGVIRSASEENGRTFGALGNQNDRVKFHAVAHGDHHIAPNVIEAGGHRRELGRSFAWQGDLRGGRRRGGLGRTWLCGQQSAGDRREEGQPGKAKDWEYSISSEGRN